MASHQDLLDAIARIRAATGDPQAWQTGLSGEDIAVAYQPLSPPGAVGAVLAKIIAAHSEAFLPPAATSAPPPQVNEGAAANAIREAESALAQQHSAAAQVDLQVVTAVLNAHAAHAGGVAELEQLQREIEAAVVSRADLDTPAGAREFQRFLVGKIRDIRNVLETVGLDATSKATLAAAMASLYGSATPDVPPPAPPVEQPGSPAQPAVAQPDSPAPEPGQQGQGSAAADTNAPPLDLADSVPELFAESIPPAVPEPMTPPVLPAAVPPPTVPAAPASWGGGMPGFGGGVPGLPDLSPAATGFEPADLRGHHDGHRADAPDESQRPSEPGEHPPEPADPATVVHLPDGDTVTAASPELAAAITAAVAGTPIPDAFGQQGIDLPAPGTPVAAPLDPGRLVPGDVGIFADRFAVALGPGKALLDGQIQPISTVTGPGFLGWQQPPPAGPIAADPAVPDVPAPNRPAQTAPS